MNWLGIEVAGERVDQLRRHVPFLLADPWRLVEHVEGRLAHLVVPQQRLQDEHVVAHSQHGEPGLLPQRELHDRHAVGVLEGATQQRVRLDRAGVWFEVVRLVQVQWVDLVGWDELDDVDVAALLSGKALQFVVGEYDGTGAVVVRLGDVLVAR